MRWPYGNKNLAQLNPFLYASDDYTDKLDRIMSSGSSAPAMSPRFRGSWPGADGSLEDERSAGDPSGPGAQVVELASGPAADAEYDWDDTAEEPFLWAHTLDNALDPPSGPPGPTCAAAVRGAPGPAVWRRATGMRRGQHAQLGPARRAAALVVVLGLAVVAALWLAGYGQAKTAQRSAAPAAAPTPATPIAPPAQARPEAVLESSVAQPASSDVPSEHVEEATVGRPGPTARAAPASSETNPGIAGSATLATQAPAAALARPAAAPAGEMRAAARPAASAPTTRTDGGEALPVPSGGSWAVVIQSFGDLAEAEGRRRQVENHGVRAEIRLASVKGQLWHRVIVPGYSSRELAGVAAAELGRRKLGEPWVLLQPQ